MRDQREGPEQPTPPNFIVTNEQAELEDFDAEPF